MTDKLTNISEILNSIQLNLKAPKDKVNTYANFIYRNAEGILEAYKEEIKREKYPNDLTLTHKFTVTLLGTRVFATCTSVLKLKDGSKEEADGFAEIEISRKGMDQGQLSGAVTSYAKKYALCNLFAIDDSKDDPDSKDNSKEEPKKEPSLKGLAESVNVEDKELREQVTLDKLHKGLSELEDEKEINDYLAYKHNGKTRLQKLESMTEVNRSEAMRIINEAKELCRLGVE